MNHVDPSKSSSSSPPKLSRVGRAALAYAERFGWAVHPPQPGGKKPITAHGFKDASVDPEQITAWWTKTPDANIGIATGKVSGISVLDVDVKDGAGGDATLAALLEKHGDSFDEHVQQQTWSGGSQIIFAYDLRARQGAGCYGTALDGRNDGGYVVAPPSIVNGAIYTWIVKPGIALQSMPAWLLDLGATVAPTSSERQNPPGWADELMLKGVAKGERDAQANRLIKHARETGKSEADCWARLTTFGLNCTPPFDPKTDKAIAKKIRKAYAQPPAFTQVPTPSLAPRTDEAVEPGAGGIYYTNLGEVEPEDVPWLWPGRIPLGMLTIVAGTPGLGKSFVTLDIASRITTGAVWPDVGKDALQGTVVLLAAEDSVKHTIVPRLIGLKADRYKVNRIDAVETVDKKGRTTFSLETDILRLEKLVVATGAKLVIVDPVNSYLGGKQDGFNDPEVRRVLDPLKEMAERLEIAVILIMHLKKGTEEEILYRIGGSVAFGAVVRSVFFCARDRETDGRVYFTHAKINVAAKSSTLAYRIHPDLSLEWGKDPIKLTVYEILAAEQKKPGPQQGARTEVKRWLVEYLKDGPKPAAEGERLAVEMEFKDATLRRAMRDLGIVSTPARNPESGQIAGYTWTLPPLPEGSAF